MIPDGAYVPAGLTLWGVMPGSAQSEGPETHQAVADEDGGPIAIIVQAATPRGVFSVLAGMPEAEWMLRGLVSASDMDRWCAEHVMHIPPKDAPAVLMVVRKDFD